MGVEPRGFSDSEGGSAEARGFSPSAPAPPNRRRGGVRGWAHTTTRRGEGEGEDARTRGGFDLWAWQPAARAPLHRRAPGPPRRLTAGDGDRGARKCGCAGGARERASGGPPRGGWARRGGASSRPLPKRGPTGAGRRRGASGGSRAGGPPCPAALASRRVASWVGVEASLGRAWRSWSDGDTEAGRGLGARRGRGPGAGWRRWATPRASLPQRGLEAPKGRGAGAVRAGLRAPEGLGHLLIAAAEGVWGQTCCVRGCRRQRRQPCRRTGGEGGVGRVSGHAWGPRR